MLKKIIILLVISVFLLIELPLVSSKNIQSNIKSGKYIPKSSLTFGSITKLPIPVTNENYAFIQNIGQELSIVTGEFNSGHRKITWFKDKNSDGEVDSISIYFVDEGKFQHISNPGKLVSSEKFKKMKEDILNGIRDSLYPNQEGIPYIKILMNDSAKVSKWKNGFQVVSTDTDEASSERVRYFFSDNKNRGADLIFYIKYNIHGVGRVSPIINYSVYCSNSIDKLIIETVQNLSKIAAQGN